MVLTGGGGLIDLAVGVEKYVGDIIIGGTRYHRYVKVIDFGALLNSDNKKDYAHGISGIIGFLSISGLAYFSSGNSMPLPYLNLNSTYNVSLSSDKTTISTRGTYSEWTNAYAYITLEYYKAS